MPMYEYRCQNCQKTFEELVPSMMTPESDIQCPECGTYNSEKLMSAFASSGPGSSEFSPTTSASSCGTGGFT